MAAVISLDARRAERERRRVFDAAVAAAIAKLDRERETVGTVPPVCPPRLRVVRP